jgi:hypothetical protein
MNLNPFKSKKNELGNVKFKKFYVGTTLRKNHDNTTDRISEVIVDKKRPGQEVYILAKAGGPFTKPYIFKYYQLT